MPIYLLILGAIPLVILELVCVVIAIRDLYRRARVRYLPRIVWLLIILGSHPTGWILYLLIGRKDEHHNMPETDEGLR